MSEPNASSDHEADDAVSELRERRGRSVSDMASASESVDSGMATLRRSSATCSWPCMNMGQEPQMRRAKTGIVRRKSHATLPLLEGSLSFASLADLEPLRVQPKFSRRNSLQQGLRRITSKQTLTLPGSRPRSRSVSEDADEPVLPQGDDTLGSGAAAQAPYVLVGVLSLIFGVLSVIPYNAILRHDPESPLFIGFATHIFFVAINVTKLREILFDRKIPLKYHVGFVILGFLFTTLKSGAFSRLPTSTCMLLLNLQMLVAMPMQRLAFGHTYSISQMLGCALVTIGVIVAGRAGKSQASASAGTDFGSDALIGLAQMGGALIALTALSLLVKVAFERFGEAAEEQIVMQHLGALPLFFLGGRWYLIGPRLVSWTVGDNKFLVVLLLLNMAISFGAQATQVRFSGRAPNLLLVQLVSTVQKFATVLIVALLAAPPFPPLGFWGGSLLLVIGTLLFLSASMFPDEDETDGNIDDDLVSPLFTESKDE